MRVFQCLWKCEKIPPAFFCVNLDPFDRLCLFQCPMANIIYYTVTSFFPDYLNLRQFYKKY